MMLKEVEISWILLELKKEDVYPLVSNPIYLVMGLLGGFWGLRVRKLIRHITEHVSSSDKKENLVLSVLPSSTDLPWQPPQVSFTKELFTWFTWWAFDYSSMHSEKEACFFPLYTVLSLYSVELVLADSSNLWFLHAWLCMARYLKLLF